MSSVFDNKPNVVVLDELECAYDMFGRRRIHCIFNVISQCA